ncbi:GNAT family N-acetyltransferase [Methyloglobulus sp.]|uniref:GNAT family N-acetyltransferase n=1 Tax=Methyloglobulus sp. TaxID=2518622 RepID=UPI0032B87121
MNTIAIRQATVSDLDALTCLFDGYRQFYGRTSDVPTARQFLLDRFNNGESTVFVALMEQKPAGFAQLYPSFSSVSMARTFILNDLFVTPSARRLGLASTLLQKAVEYAKQRGAIRLTLSTAIANEPAQALYESQGWQKDEQFFVYHFATNV